MKYIVLVVSALLAGCAAQVVSSNPRQVIVRGPDGATVEAQKLAEAECSKHQRFARLVARPSYNSDQFVFDCVS